MNQSFGGAALQSFLFGVVTALAIGPIALFILHQAITRGFGVAWRCAVGASLADFTYALAAFTFGSVVAPYIEESRAVVRAVGSVVLIALGVWLISRALRLRGAPDAARPAARRGAGPMLLTYMLTIANPMTILFMLGLATQLPLARITLPSALVLAVCLFAGTCSVGLALAAGGAGLRRMIERPSVIRALEMASGVGIVLFGIRGLLS